MIGIITIIIINIIIIIFWIIKYKQNACIWLLSSVLFWSLTFINSTIVEQDNDSLNFIINIYIFKQKVFGFIIKIFNYIYNF
jgi:hypothetical protein